MKKHRLIILAGILLAISAMCVSAQVSGSEDWSVVQIPCRTMILTLPQGVDAKQKPVRFPHPQHFDYSCKTCHHTWDGYSPIGSCMAAECHDSTTSVSRKEPKEEYIKYYMAAYHGQCRDCHKGIHEENKKIEAANADKPESDQEPLLPNGPWTCRKCHAEE